MRSRLFAFIPLIALVFCVAGLELIKTSGSETGRAALTEKPSAKSGLSAVKSENASSANAEPIYTGNEKRPEVEPKAEMKGEPEPFRIIAVGDIMLGRGVGARLQKQNKDYTYPFERVSHLLKSGDIVFGNLEAPITEETKCLNPKYKFVLKNRTQALEGLKYAGFNLLSLANNHILDYYAKGLHDTMNILDRHGIAYSGAGRNLDESRRPAVIEKKGTRIGMLSYTDMAHFVYRGSPQISFAAGREKEGVAPRVYDYIAEDIKRLKTDVDLLIVSLHWGVEESFNVLPDQVEFAHNLIDKGADMILGHHPHQFQGVEIYKGKPIFYSLGNFIFDQNDPENQESFIIKMEYIEKKLSSLTAIPVRIAGKVQVVPVTGPDAANLLSREIELCSRLNTKCRVVSDRIEFELH